MKFKLELLSGTADLVTVDIDGKELRSVLPPITNCLELDEGMTARVEQHEAQNEILKLLIWNLGAESVTVTQWEPETGKKEDHHHLQTPNPSGMFSSVVLWGYSGDWFELGDRPVAVADAPAANALPPPVMPAGPSHE